MMIEIGNKKELRLYTSCFECKIFLLNSLVVGEGRGRSKFLS
jgi:hypothetical protein